MDKWFMAQIDRLRIGGNMALGAAHELEKKHADPFFDEDKVVIVVRELIKAIKFASNPYVRGAIKSALITFAQKSWAVSEGLTHVDHKLIRDIGVSLTTSIFEEKMIMVAVQGSNDDWTYKIVNESQRVVFDDMLDTRSIEYAETNILPFLNYLLSICKEKGYAIIHFQVLFIGKPQRNFQLEGTRWLEN